MVSENSQMRSQPVQHSNDNDLNEMTYGWPFEAASTADCYEKQAWGGKFPVQIRVAKNTTSRKSNLLISSRHEFLSRRKSQPKHYFDDPLARDAVVPLAHHLVRFQSNYDLNFVLAISRSTDFDWDTVL